MVLTEIKAILWTGPKHSGKTTSAANLADEARERQFRVAGILAPSIYADGRLVGFDILDLRTGDRTLLAKRRSKPDKSAGFAFTRDGRKLGKEALKIQKSKPPQLIIVDEFGPVELAGRGWRKQVDSIMLCTDALKVFVVRDELARRVQKLYAGVGCLRLAANRPESVARVIKILKSLRRQEQ
jgi:nucleoside-triphosphatase THEP1